MLTAYLSESSPLVGTAVRIAYCNRETQKGVDDLIAAAGRRRNEAVFTVRVSLCFQVTGCTCFPLFVVISRPISFVNNQLDLKRF